MKYRVVVHRLAMNDLFLAHRWVSKHAPVTADRWLARFEDAIISLGQRADRCPTAIEATKTRLDLRQYLFGRKPNVFRVIFAIDQDTLRDLRIRRAQRRSLTAGEIRDAENIGE